MMYFLLAAVLLILFFAWKSYSGYHGDNNETMVYMQGHNTDPDSDSDMQEQYDYRNKTDTD